MSKDIFKVLYKKSDELIALANENKNSPSDFFSVPDELIKILKTAKDNNYSSPNTSTYLWFYKANTLAINRNDLPQNTPGLNLPIRIKIDESMKCIKIDVRHLTEEALTNNQDELAPEESEKLAKKIQQALQNYPNGDINLK